MKKLLLKALCLVLALLLTLAAAVCVILRVPDELQGSIAGTAHYKTALLAQTENDGPRVIFAGGSSSPYGTDCAAVEAATGRTAINVGATAYLGLEYYISLLTKYAREGDIVVLAPEHMMLAADCVDYTIAWQAAGNDPAVWQTMPLRYLPGLLCNMDDYYNLRKSTYDGNVNNGTAGKGEAYHADFGPLGDVTAYREPLLESGWNTLDPVYLEAYSWDETCVQRINAFASAMQKRGVTVLFAFAPLDELCVQSSAEDVAAYEQTLTDALDVPVILTEEQAILPAAYFYDSNNHLTTAGAAINTQNLIDGLEGYLG